MQDWVWWGFFVATVNTVLAAAVTVHAVLWKRDRRSVISWVGLAWLAPIVGALAYVCLGINRIERKAVSLARRESKHPATESELEAEDIRDVEAFTRQHRNLVGLANAGRSLTGVSLVPGNEVEPLVDGDEAYPAMIDAIEAAQSSVTLLSYIFDSDRSGDEFLEAMTNARQRGVQVRVLIDDVGSKYSRPNMVSRLQEAGIPTASFLPTKIPLLPRYMNLRNHRKILVCDGTTGFTGGTNIREGHCLGLKPKYPVQCLHFRLRGPVVAQLQRVFDDDWAFATGENLTDQQRYANSERFGSVWARGIEHGPDENLEKLADLIAAGLASARDRVRVVTPYFLPHLSLIQALNVAAMRDVHVEVLVPSQNNIALVQWASTAQMWQMLGKGVRIYETRPPFDHTKLMLVDDIWALIGSTNWDPRSLRLNFEFNVECYSLEFADKLNKIIDAKLADAREITLEEVNSRPLHIRLRDGLARLFSPYL